MAGTAEIALAFFAMSVAIVLGLVVARTVMREPREVTTGDPMARLERALCAVAGSVQAESPLFGPKRFRVRVALDPDRPDDDAPYVVWRTGRCLYVRGPALRAPMRVTFTIPPPRWGAELLGRLRTGDDLFDGACAIRAPQTMRSYIRLLVEEGRLVEPAVVLARLEGVHSLRGELVPDDAGGHVRVRLAGEALLEDPTRMGSLLRQLARFAAALEPET